MKQLNQTYQAKPNTAAVALEFLNIRDITTMVPRLRQFKYMDTLSLHGNQLTSIPSLEILQGLRELDLSKNPIKIDNRLLDSLFAIPNLESLSIDVRSQEQRMKIIQNLPKLNYLNGNPIQRQKEVRPPKEQEMKIIKQKLASEQGNVKALLDNIYSILDENSAPPDTSQEVYFSLKCIMQQFQYFYQNINSSMARDCVLMYYKSKLYQVADTHLSTYLEDHDHQNIATAIDELNKTKRENFQEILKIVLSYAYEEDFTKKTVEPGNKLRKEVLYQNQITRLKKQVAQLLKENQQLQHTNQKYLEKIYHGRKNGSSTGNYENRTLQASRLNSNNNSSIPTPVSKNNPKTPTKRQQSKKQFIRTPSKSGIKQEINRTPSKSGIQQEINKSPSRPNFSISNTKRESYQQLDKIPNYQVLPRNKKLDQTNRNYQKTNSLASFSINRLKPNPSTKSIQRGSNLNDEDIKRSSSRQNLSQNQQKKLTLDQMIQFIDEFIYEKGKINLQFSSKGELFQTPQQFLYTYFLRKYGLKDMALEWSLLVIKAIQKYSKDNIIVEVFGKILKNTIEEEYYLKCKDFQGYLNSSIPSMQSFTGDDVREIFYALFPDEDEDQFERFISKLESETVKGEKVYRRRPLMFKLEAHNVKKHQKHISKFLNHFKLHDKDEDGIIEGDEIEKCISTFIKKHSDLLDAYQNEENLQSVKEQILAKRRKKGNAVSMTFSQFISAMRDHF